MTDDLTVARRALARALTLNAELRLQISRSSRHVSLIASALQRDPRPPDDDVARALTYLRRGLGFSPQGPEDVESIRLSRPTEPPPPPQATGAVAIVCSCLVWLRTAADMRQHWETGCFDVPVYEGLIESLTEPSSAELSGGPDPDPVRRAFWDRQKVDLWIKGY